MACSSPFGREGLALRPGKAHGFPALEPPSMAIGIEWPLETVRDIATAPIASRRHRSGSLEAALPGATDEKQLAILIGAERRQRLDHPLDERSILPFIGVSLPFDQHGPLADGIELRQADVGPLGNGAH